MARVKIIIEDARDGSFDADIDFDIPVTSGVRTKAQKLGVAISEYLIEQSNKVTVEVNTCKGKGSFRVK